MSGDGPWRQWPYFIDDLPPNSSRSVACYCTGRCRALGYCPNNPPPFIGGISVVFPETREKPRIRVKAGREVIA